MRSKIRKKKEVYSFQTGFRGNIKEPGLTGFENNAVSPDDLKLFKGRKKSKYTEIKTCFSINFREKVRLLDTLLKPQEDFR